MDWRTLPTNIDDTHADDPDDPSRKEHQQHHDAIGEGLKELDNATSGSGKIVQKVTAVSSSTAFATTAITFTATGLAASITPLHADSILIIETTGYAQSALVSGSSASRLSRWRIQNTTDGVSVDGAGRIDVGRFLDAASSASADSRYPAIFMGRYVVNSTAARTFELQVRSDTSDIETRLANNITRAVMAITEVRP